MFDQSAKTQKAFGIITSLRCLFFCFLLTSSPAFAVENSLIQEFERLRLQHLAYQEKSQKEIDELFASVDPVAQPKAYLTGYMLASDEVKKQRQAPTFAEMLARAKTLGDPYLLAELYLNEASSIRDKDQDQAFRYLDEAGAIAKASGNDLQQGLILVERAYIHYVYFNRQESVKTIERALELMKDHKDHPYYLEARSTLAMILYSTNRQDESARISLELVDRFKALQYHASASIAASNTATFFEDKNPPDVEKATALFEVAIEEAKLSGDRMAMATALSGNGRLSAPSQPDKAIASLVQSIALYHELNKPVYETDSSLLLADTYIKQGNTRLASQVLENVARIPESEAYHQEKILHLKSKVAALNHDYKAAFDLFKEYHNKQQARKRSEEDAELNRLSTSMNLRIEEEKNKNLELALEKSDKERELLLATLGLVLLIAVGMLWGLWQGVQIKRQKQLLQEVMDSVHEGILRFGMDRRLIPPYSRYLEQILGHNKLLGVPISEIIFPEDKQQGQQLHACLDAILGENQLCWDLNAVQLPENIQYGNKVLQLFWYPMQHSGIIHGLMLVLRDISEQKAYETILQTERAHQAKRNEQTMELQQSDMGRSQRFLSRMESWLKQNPELSETPAVLLRHLHTWKGEARTLGLKQMALCLHASEQSMGVDSIRSILHEYQSILDENKTARQQSARRDVLSVCGDLFTEARERARQARLRWGGLQVNDELESLDEATGDVIREILLHAIANSIDHGYIHSSADFQQSAKIHFTLNAWESDKVLHLQLLDNGQGIHWPRVQKLAEAQGITSLQKADMIKVLFADGTSTADSTSLSSGRGVGLAAIRAICTEHQGIVSLRERTEGSGTCLQVELPLPVVSA